MQKEGLALFPEPYFLKPISTSRKQNNNSMEIPRNENQLSDYETERRQNILLNYEFMKSCGLPVQPSLCVKIEHPDHEEFDHDYFPTDSNDDTEHVPKRCRADILIRKNEEKSADICTQSLPVQPSLCVKIESPDHEEFDNEYFPADSDDHTDHFPKRYRADILIQNQNNDEKCTDICTQTCEDYGDCNRIDCSFSGSVVSDKEDAVLAGNDVDTAPCVTDGQDPHLANCSTDSRPRSNVVDENATVGKEARVPLPNGVGNDLPNGLGNDLPNGIGNDLPNGIGNDLPNGIDNDLPNGICNDLPNGIGNDLPNGIGNDLPNGIGSDLPNGIGNDTSLLFPNTGLDISARDDTTISTFQVKQKDTSESGEPNSSPKTKLQEDFVTGTQFSDSDNNVLGQVKQCCWCKIHFGVNFLSSHVKYCKSRQGNMEIKQNSSGPNVMNAYNSYTLAKWESYQQTHTGVKTPYECDIFGKGFNPVIQLPNIIINQQPQTGERLYLCYFYGERLSESDQLKIHQYSQTEESPYVCNFCGKGFMVSDNLKLHEEIHVVKKPVKKPYKCDVCGKGFATSSYLEKHKFTHTGKKPYKCDVCDRRFTRLYSVQKHHERIHKKDH